MNRSCDDATDMVENYLTSLLMNISEANNITLKLSLTTEGECINHLTPEEDNDAVWYIIIVLSFYSFGIVFMMVKYIKEERRELEETRLYNEYVKSARERLYKPIQNKWRPMNRLALTALNTVNSIPQTTKSEGKVTYV